MNRLIALLLLALWPGQTLAQTSAPEPGPVAWFGVHFLDTSTEGAINGIRADETARVAASADYVAKDMRARGFTLVDMAPVAARLNTVKNPAHCNGCEVAIAHDLGARYALTGEVQKVSNLILNLNLVLRDAQSGTILRAGVVDIRGNTDESWRRGFSYLLRNIMFR